MARPEYRINVVVSQLGAEDHAEAHMERFIDAFESLHPEAGAVMAANYHLAAIDATFSVEADDARQAAQIGGDLFCEVATATEIPPTEILEISATLVSVPDHESLTDEIALV